MSRAKFFAFIVLIECALAIPNVFSQTKPVVMGEGVRGAMYLPAYIAEEKGFFKKRELDTRMVTFSRSNAITRWSPAIFNSISRLQQGDSQRAWRLSSENGNGHSARLKPRDDRGRLRDLSPDDALEALCRSERDENSNRDDRRSESQGKEYQCDVTGRFIVRGEG